MSEPLSVRTDPGGPRRHDASIRLFVRKAMAVAAVVLAILFLWRIREVLAILFVAAVLSSGIAPAIRRVRAWIRLYTGRRIRRGTAVLLVYFPFLVAAVLFAIFALPNILVQTGTMMEELPKKVDERVLTPARQYLPVDAIRTVATRAFGGETPLFGYVRGAVHAAAAFVAILFLIVYMLIDAERLRNLYLLFYPPEERSSRRRTIRRISRRMSSWLAAQLMLASIIGGMTLAALLLLGIPYAVPLAIVAAIGEVVPVIGPILGAIPALTVAIFQSPWQFWAVLAMAILVQMIENYLIVPRLMGSRVALSPLSVFVAFMIGASLFGIVGALMAVPAAAIIQVVFEEAFVEPRERRRGDRPGTLGSRD